MHVTCLLFYLLLLLHALCMLLLFQHAFYLYCNMRVVLVYNIHVTDMFAKLQKHGSNVHVTCTIFRTG